MCSDFRERWGIIYTKETTANCCMAVKMLGTNQQFSEHKFKEALIAYNSREVKLQQKIMILLPFIIPLKYS